MAYDSCIGAPIELTRPSVTTPGLRGVGYPANSGLEGQVQQERSATRALTWRLLTPRMRLELSNPPACDSEGHAWPLPDSNG